MTKPLDILTKARLEGCLSCPAEKLEERLHKLMTMVKLNCDPSTERDGLWEKYALCCGVADPQLRHELLRIVLEGQMARYIGMNEIHRIFRMQFYPLLEDALGLPAGQLGGVTGPTRDPGGHKTNQKVGRGNRTAIDSAENSGQLVHCAGAPRPDVVFQLWSGDSGIFFKNEDWVRLSAIHQALQTARTWGEFEQLCTEDEFENLSLWYQSEGEYVYKVGGEFKFISPEELDGFLEGYGNDYVITPEDASDSSKIPGVEDGDYPPWLDSTAEDILPEDFVETFAEVVNGGPASGGPWTVYPVSEIDEMVRWLEVRGFSVSVRLEYE